jgi:hypothetical protein
MFSGLWRCVDPGLTDVSVERIVSIFRIEKSANGDPASASADWQRAATVQTIFVVSLRLQRPKDTF